MMETKTTKSTTETMTKSVTTMRETRETMTEAMTSLRSFDFLIWRFFWLLIGVVC